LKQISLIGDVSYLKNTFVPKELLVKCDEIDTYHLSCDISNILATSYMAEKGKYFKGKKKIESIGIKLLN
jgi:hypothetical protein